MFPQITTIIPTFQRPISLKRAILSTLEQDYNNIQICVYDNHSNDETRDVVYEFMKVDSRVKYFCHSKNIGGLRNFLYGMKQVKTNYFSFLSDDDYLLPNFYSKAITALEKHDNAMFWAGMTLHIDEYNVIWYTRLAQWLQEGLYEPPEGTMILTGGMAPPWTSILFRKAAIEKVGLLDISLLGPSDLEYCLRIAAHYPYIVEKHPAAVFVLNTQSYSATQPMSSFWPGWKRMIEKFSNDLSLSKDFRSIIVTNLQKDAESMLLRRGANALAKKRLDFAKDAADILSLECNQKLKGLFLYSLMYTCSKSNTFQNVYTKLYRGVEKNMINSKKDLQAEYGHLLRSL